MNMIYYIIAVYTNYQWMFLSLDEVSQTYYFTSHFPSAELFSGDVIPNNILNDPNLPISRDDKEKLLKEAVVKEVRITF